MAGETVLGFRIEVRGTDKQTANIAQLEQALVKLRQERTKLNKKIRDGIPLTASETKALGTLKARTDSVTKALKQQTVALNNVGKAQKKTTSFTQKLGKSILQAGVTMIGVTAAIGLITRGISAAVSIFIDFEKANSKLEAVLGATDDQMVSLSDQAKELGSSTKFTATSVTELQTEFAKLGFPTEDILLMTEATLNGAAALGSGLAEQAALTGATLKQYGLDASAAAEVNDILATAAANSALDFAKLSTALPIVGATANAVGVDLKETTSLLGRLSDRGLDASTSATSLRNVFLELSIQGLTMQQAMDRINNSTDKAKTSFELFGKRGATTGLILADMEGITTKLDEALVDVDGAAKRMAETMLNNLSGDITKAQSAMEGFVLSLEDGQGSLSLMLRSITQTGTSFLNLITNLNNGKSALESFNKFSEEAVITQRRFSDQAEALGVTNENLTKVLLNNGEAFKVLSDQLKSGEIDIIKFRKGVNTLADGYKRLTDEEKKELEISKEKAALDKKQQEENNTIVQLEAEAAAKEVFTAKEIEANKKKNDQIAADNEKAKAKEVANQIKVQEQLDTLEIAAIEDKRIREAAELVAAFEKKVESITGDSEKEIELQKQLKIQLETALQQQQAEFDAIDQEKKLTDRQLQLENELILAEEDLESRRLILEQQRALELEQANLTGSQIDVINKRFDEILLEDAKKQTASIKALAEAESNAKIQSISLTSDALSVAAGFAKEGSKEQKILASASALISTYLSAQQAYASQFLPVPTPSSPIRGGVAAGVAIASGLQNVARINSVKFSEGGYVDGASHEQGGIQMYHKSGQHIGEMEGNEYIMSGSTVNRIGRDNLDAMNFGSGSANGFFAHGGSVPNVAGLSASQAQSSTAFDVEGLANMISTQMQEAILRLEVVNNATETAAVANNVINTESELSFG